MSKYELDDDMVRKFVTAAPAAGRSNGGVVAPLADALKSQIPIPVPVKVGAVVRTEGKVFDPALFVRWALDGYSVSPWLQANSDTPYRTDEIGRITEVLSPGVDL